MHVNGLLPGQAIVTVDGQQRVLKAGKPSPEGLVLVEADSQRAVLEWQGERFEAALSRQIASNFSERAKNLEFRINRGSHDHYTTTGLINGRPVSFLVDTGAFAVAMNHHVADKLGLNWRNGRRFIAGTAGGGTPSYEVTLNSVTVGEITLNNVRGAVIVADTDDEILLGMSFLSQTEMREEGDVLILRKKF